MTDKIVTTQLDTNLVSMLIKTYGSPLYVFNRKMFIENYQQLLSAFRAIYPKYNIAYSYKTNYTPSICQTVKNLGGYAEVVSGMEYQLAKKIGYSSDKIIFNGPVKSDDMFEQLIEGGVVNVDNLDELAKIIVFAREKAISSPKMRIKLAFRLNIDIKQGFISRFGIDADNADITKAFALAGAEQNIDIIGIHCHIGRSRDLQFWRNRVDRMIEIVDKYFNIPPRFIDLGSGMNSVMESVLAAQFGECLPTYKEYAKIVATAFCEKYGKLPQENQPELLTEPGTTLISGYMSFIATVTSIKTVKEKTYITFDGSSENMGDICRLKQLPITLHKNLGCSIDAGTLINNGDFVGYTCLEDDVMYKNFCGVLEVGDIVEFRNIGSYSNVLKPPFIYPNCAIVELNGSDTVRLIKRKETFNDVFLTYIF